MYVGGKIHDAGLFSTVSGTLKNLSIAESFVDGNYHAGAFCGNVDFKGMVIGCHNSGNVRGVYAVGGIFGGHMAVQTSFNIPLVLGCSNSGTVTGEEYVGGIGGMMDEIISRCHNSGTVTGEFCVGGIVGSGKVEQCCNEGTVTGDDAVGGIAGNSTSVRNSYNTAAVTGMSDVGGIAGHTSWGTELFACYNVGRVEGSLVGELGQEGAILHSYCLDTAGKDIPVGQSITAEQLKNQEFLNNWNFYSVWELGYHKDYDYPTLRFFGSQYYRYIFQKDSLGEVLSVEIVEDGTSFEENAWIKAATPAAMGYIGIADDSGLSVDALGGAPGIYSARYGGEAYPTDKDRMYYLLSRMEGVEEEKRGAKFVTVITMLLPDGRKVVAKGECPGRILTAPQGDNGFGYDPVFYYPEAGCSFAGMSGEEKNRISHRARALQNFAEQIRKEKEL
jgi:XTP/dITP diphosphohydrolase